MYDSTKLLVAMTAMNEMFRGSHFDICAVRDVARMLAITPDAEAMAMLSPLHCVNWSRMPKELLQRVPEIIQQALGGPEKFKFDMAPTGQLNALVVGDPSPQTTSWLKEMFSLPLG